MSGTTEQRRLDQVRESQMPWKKWGPYLSERQWGTVREDYSEDGDAWDFFTHDQARSRAYRWGEDGLAGISDDKQRLCFALALWNGKDPILKERLFGLTNSEGNHGEDVKEYYFYLDSTPTHSYMKYLYKYPQAAFPYADLVATNGAAAATNSSTSCSIPASSTRTATSTCSSSTPRRRPKTSDPDHRRQSRPRGGRAARAADAVVPQRLVVVDRDGRREATLRQVDGTGGHGRRSRPAHPQLGDVLPVLRRRRAAAVHRKRDEHTSGFSGSPERAALTSRTASTTTSCTAQQDAVNPERRAPRLRRTTG